MKLFCPACGRAQSYNSDQPGLTPKICPACIFQLEASAYGSSFSRIALRVPHHLKERGLTFILN